MPASRNLLIVLVVVLLAALAVTGASVLKASWYAFASMIGTSIMLGAVFIAIGYLVSSLVRDRGTAAALSSRSTVMRTISEPARCSAATWATV